MILNRSLTTGNNLPNCKPVQVILVLFDFVNLMLLLYTDSVNTTNILNIERAALRWVHTKYIIQFCNSVDVGCTSSCCLESL